MLQAVSPEAETFPLMSSVCLCVPSHRATSRKGMSFSTARPSDVHLWDITLEPGRGSDTQTISVTCQKKTTFTSKRQALDASPSLFLETTEPQTLRSSHFKGISLLKSFFLPLHITSCGLFPLKPWELCDRLQNYFLTEKNILLISSPPHCSGTNRCSDNLFAFCRMVFWMKMNDHLLLVKKVQVNRIYPVQTLIKHRQ